MPPFVTVVSGLPRSGTSMMMKMLEAGGLEVLSDGIRKPDHDNPRGYYEYERVKKLRNGDDAWLVDARGKVVKVISELLRYLAPEHAYRVVFMRRNMDEVLASQREMLLRKGVSCSASGDERLAASYASHLKHTESWLETQPNVDVLYLNYCDVLCNLAEHVKRVSEFLGGSLDTASMAAAVDPTLYRQRMGQQALQEFPRQRCGA